MPESIRADKKPSSTKLLALLKPGLSLSLVVNTNIIRETNDIRASTLHDISGGKLILAQTDPYLSSTYLNKSITVSFLGEEKENPIRYGFQARIIDFIKEYRLSSSQTAPAIVAKQETLPDRYNLRMFYRIHPPSEHGLSISIKDQPMGIIDISIGGAIISASRDQDREFKFEMGKTIIITLTLDHQAFNLGAEIKRIISDDQKWSRELVFIALQFCDRTLELDRVLGGKILDIQRELRSKGLDP